jgi:EmrB/QacA subfamily drug resistance transporter
LRALTTGQDSVGDTPYRIDDTAYRFCDTLYRMSSSRLDPALMKLALIVVLGAMAAILDLTIVNVAIDTLQRDFHADVSTVQWVSTGYALAVSLVIPVTGWAVERFGSRRLWLIALTVFVVGSSLCGLAWSIGSLIAFRILQGIGGGMLLPLAQVILTQAAGRDRIGRIMPFVAVPAQLAPILGPVIGGLIVGHISWRWVFYVNVPVCLAAIIAAWRGMPRTEVRGGHRLDVRGLALLSPALGLIIYGFSEAGSHGGFARGQVLTPLLAGVALLAGFTVHALRTSNPIVDLRLFRARGFATSSAIMFASGISLFGALLLLPLYYQQARGASPLEAGLLLAPQGLGTMLAMVVAARLSDRLPPRPIALVGMALVTLATVPYAVWPNASEGLLSLAMVLRGAGLGAALVPVMTASYIGLPDSAIARATTGVRIFQQVGAALGTAVLAVILQHSLRSGGSVADAFGATFWWTVGLTAVAFVPAALLPGRAAVRAQATAAAAQPA